jgi:isocitrate/isopropylmalate dehydrogenase
MTERIAVIPGDGAGPEVVAEARKAVDALGLPIEWEVLDWGTARYHAEGATMPPDALTRADVRRVLEYAFERAEQRRGVVTSATALEAVCREGPRTRDVGGSASASEVGDAVAAEVRAG